MIPELVLASSGEVLLTLNPLLILDFLEGCLIDQEGEVVDELEDLPNVHEGDKLDHFLLNAIEQLVLLLLH